MAAQKVRRKPSVTARLKRQGFDLTRFDRTIGYHDPADAERIARALRVLDAMEERDTQITEAMQDMAEDEPAVPQARGEG